MTYQREKSGAVDNFICGTLNGGKVIADPLGGIYSFLTNKNTIGGAGARRVDETLGVKADDSNHQSLSYCLGELFGGGLTLAAQIATYGAFQGLAIIADISRSSDPWYSDFEPLEEMVSDYSVEPPKDN